MKPLTSRTWSISRVSKMHQKYDSMWPMEYKEPTINLMAHPLAYGDNNYVGIKRQMGQSGIPIDFD